MISFACAGCGHKLQVPNDVAGKSVRCSLCKHVMIIAAPAALATTIGLPSIDGQPSSLARAGLDGGVTIGQQGDSDEESPTNPRSLQALLNNGASRGERYQVAGELARGGMGAVLRAIDCDIRREVAVKYLLDQSDPRKKARFVEEAQITGQLEHPNIVPIHELGIDADKRLFFSMKMVRGRSLAQVLKDLRDIPRSSEKEYTLSRLLTIFVNICHALAYAHSRGVIHRDLKPANIMLGDFGEVYVMDWGLAKVLQRRAAQPSSTVIQTTPSFAWAGEAGSKSMSGTLQTSRREADDQTVDGTVMGTAVYMPPEQARGDLTAIDQRSDVYSLGAVLYEMLTLQPPIDKAGGFRAILQRVQNGEILPPAQREPARARAGKIPVELAAVAMKALAHKPEDRYQTVEALRSDIERFLDGRSVSVKEDTRREAFIKLVKRNKGFSAGAAAALLVLILSSIFLLQSWLATRRAYAAYQKEQEDKRAQARQSVPAFVEAARVAVQRRKFDDALAHLNVALDYDAEYGPARLLKGQLLAARKEFTAARPELERYSKSQPRDSQAARLARLCARGKPDDPAVVAELADILLRQNLPTLAEGLIQAPEKLLEVYRRKIEDAWPGLGARLSMDKDSHLILALGGCKQVLSLTPLRGMPLRHLDVASLQLRDLAPLTGMPLAHLNLSACSQIEDLTPLAGMPLAYLDLSSCKQIKDLTPLAGMPLTYLNLVACNQIKDLTPLQGMPLKKLSLYYTDQIKDLRLLAGMPLTDLNISFCPRLKDWALPPIATLTTLSVSYCGGIEDLALLKGQSLTSLSLAYCAIRDLSALEGLPLTHLAINYSSGLADLTPLRRMPLTHLSIVNGSSVTDLTPLTGMPLTHLTLSGCGSITDLKPLAGMPLLNLDLRGCPKASDLTPLESMKLRRLTFATRTVQHGLAGIRRMKSLENINDVPAAEFWKRYNAGEFR